MEWVKRKPKYRMSDIDGEDATTISISQPQQTASQANRIYFYNYVDDDSVLELNKQIDEASKQMRIIQISLDLPSPPPIKLYINSPGGSLTAAMCAVDKIRSCPVPVHTYCEGWAASGATLMSVSGKKRFITENSFFLIHQLSADFWGKFVELEDQMQNMQMMMAVIRGVYLKNTKIPEKELNDLLEHDIYMSPQVCLDWGFVDKII